MEKERPVNQNPESLEERLLIAKRCVLLTLGAADSVRKEKCAWLLEYIAAYAWDYYQFSSEMALWRWMSKSRYYKYSGYYRGIVVVKAELDEDRDRVRVSFEDRDGREIIRKPKYYFETGLKHSIKLIYRIETAKDGGRQETIMLPYETQTFRKHLVRIILLSVSFLSKGRNIARRIFMYRKEPAFIIFTMFFILMLSFMMLSKS